MRATTRARRLAVGATLAGAVGILAAMGPEPAPPVTAQRISVVGRYPCEEDEILAGVGDFTGSDGWQAYRCSHPDEMGGR
jgi:hypothetical protein